MGCPKVFIPKGKLCKIEELKMSDKRVSDETKDLRELYAKFALLMFYPNRKLVDLKRHGSYWKLFEQELDSYREGNKTTFWKKDSVYCRIFKIG